ncbi:MAG: TerC family protein [Rhodospirillales bacterium]
MSDPHAWVSLLTLTVMEIVLGIDNLIFLAILSGCLAPDRQATARRLGLILALGSRLALLATIAWIMRLAAPLFAIAGQSFSWRDMILIGGGLFLVYKGTVEIHERIEGDRPEVPATGRPVGMVGILAQIVVLDIVFSFDSVITAVGMANDLEIMMAAVVLAVIAMLFAAGPLSAFIVRHPTVKMLALSFLLLIGMTLIADGFGAHVGKGYVYAAMAFSAAVESLNLFVGRRHRKPPAQEP